MAEQEILNQVKMFALLVPSLEFIPDFNSFIEVMQYGLIDDNKIRQR